MRELLIKFLVTIYLSFKKSHQLRILIKSLFGNRRYSFDFKGVTFQANPNSAMESSIIFKTYNEELILDLIRHFSIKGFDMIDAGANIGIHSLIAASANPKIEIYSFEPEPNNYDNFIKNLILNNFLNIRPFKMGLGNQVINLTLNINKEWNKGKHSLKKTFEGSDEKVLIPITKLDFFKDNLKNSDLIVKIDVEGFELEVIEGGKSIFQETENSILFIELLKDNNDARVCEFIFRMLKEFGYGNSYMIKENELIGVKDFRESTDYLFIKGEKAKLNLSEFISNT